MSVADRAGVGLVDRARSVAEELLSESLPRRWSHTMGVAQAASELVVLVGADCADEIVAAAWLHDIGYSPPLVVTGFHPVDGARYVARLCTASAEFFPHEVASLVAHHSGARFEAGERGLQAALAAYALPEGEKLRVLDCADLCTSPDGVGVDPAVRLGEVLHRYPEHHPVHRAIAGSGPTLRASADQVLDAAAAEMSRRGGTDCGELSFPFLAGLIRRRRSGHTADLGLAGVGGDQPCSPPTSPVARSYGQAVGIDLVKEVHRRT